MSKLRVITSCSQKRLLESFADNINSQPLPPLENECIITLSKGMNRWISMELAKRLKVSAGLKFNFPNDFLDRSFKAVLSESHSSIPFTHASLTWRIATLLPSLSQSSGFEQVSAYLGDGSDDRRLLQISSSIANCFDQYTIFRPEMVLNWDNGLSNDWQALLWRAINKECMGNHRAALLKDLHLLVSKGTPLQSKLPSRVTFFGISYLPPFHLEALRLLSQSCEVTIYLLNPCGEYWGTIISDKIKINLLLNSPLSFEAEEYYETGNPILSSLGKLGQEFIEELLGHDFEIEEIDTLAECSLHNDAATSPTILSTVQNDIISLYNRQTSDSKILVSSNDHSLQIHSCHGPLREMEVLYDNLLAKFDELTALEPRHIVVMIPDIDSYTPYINAVFGNRSSGRPPLPYTIADRSVRRESPFVGAFLKIIDIANCRFTLQEMLELLEIPAVMNRFCIDKYELELIRNWLEECNVRWGLDADHRAALGFPGYADFSWQTGMNRLFLGYAMSPRDSSTFKEILPYHSCSGHQARVLGKLAEFITTVREVSIRINTPHHLDKWADILTMAVERLLLTDENDPNGPLVVAKAINSLREAYSLYGFSQSIKINAIKDNLAASMVGSGDCHGFMNGSVTFCSMLPMRSIPMRVIWLAGMNDGVFPRTERPVGFNLMNGTRRRGDRSLRDEDRYLFLEALMAAEDCFCISYNGQSDRDNSKLTPSVLVAELIDYVTNSFVESDSGTLAAVCVSHRLQGFSPQYFNNQETYPLFSYDKDSCQALEARRISKQSKPRSEFKTVDPDNRPTAKITLQQLQRFFANPSAAFLEQRLNVIAFNPADTLEDAEPFALDTLSNYNLTQELVNQLLKGADYIECLSAVQSRGILPPLSTGKAAFDSVWENSRQFATVLQNQLGSPMESLTVAFGNEQILLSGVIENCQSGVHTRWRCARMKGRDRLSIWLEHLLLNIAKADGYPLESKLIASDRTLKLPPVENAAAIMSDLLFLYGEGMKHPLRFFPETSWHYLSGGQRKAESSWYRNKRTGSPGERDNQAVALCFGRGEPWGDEFSSLAERIYGPLITIIK